METDSQIHFQGPGPCYLPVAQRATATGQPNSGVTMTVYALVSEQAAAQANPHTEVVPISIHMTSQIARQLAHHLLRAAVDGDT